MKKNLLPKALVLLMTFFFWGCSKMDEPEPVLSSSELANAVMAVGSPTSTTGMKNYESYYRSSVDNKIHGYIVSVPLNYTPEDSTVYPLLLFLHGAAQIPWQVDYDLGKLKLEGPHKEIFNSRLALPAVVASLQMAKDDQEFNPALVREFVNILTGKIPVPNPGTGGRGLGAYKLSSKALHLTGISAGGFGAYKAAAANPDLFASISVFGGYPDSQTNMSRIKIPAYIRHNDRDPIVAVSSANNARKWLDAAKPPEPVNFQIFSSDQHDCWTSEYKRTDESSVYNWHWKHSGGDVPSEEPVDYPTVVSLSPVTNSTITASNTSTLSLVFSKDVRKGSGSIIVKNLTAGRANPIDVNSSYVKITGNRVDIYPVKHYDNSSYAYQITPGTFTDIDGNPFQGITDDVTWTHSVGRTTVLSISELLPATNTSIAATNTGRLSIIFNSAVKKGTGSIIVKNLTTGNSNTIDINSSVVTVSGSRVDVYPVKQFNNCIYAYRITSGAIKDLDGNAFAGISDDVTWTYSVGSPLLVSSFSPATNSTVPATTNATLTIVFRSAVKKGKGTIIVKNLTAGRANSIDISSSTIKVIDNRVEITAVKQYAGSVYAYQISAGAFTDMQGNAFGGISDDETWRYTVAP